MVDDRRREATRVKGNVTQGGRYGEAGEEPHMEPEVPRLGIEDAEARPPESFGGALPENQAQREREVDVPRDRSVVRLPDATSEALTEDEE